MAVSLNSNAINSIEAFSAMKSNCSSNLNYPAAGYACGTGNMTTSLSANEELQAMNPNDMSLRTSHQKS